MDPLLSILVRNADAIESDAWLLGIPSSTLPLPQTANYFCTTFDAVSESNWQNFSVKLGWFEPEDTRTQVILYLPKSKPEARMLLQWSLAYLAKSGGSLWIVGHNDGGIKSVPGLLKQTDYQAHKIDSARHCAIFEIHVAANPEQVTRVGSEQFITQHQLNNTLNLSSMPGVFNHGKIDVGTELLLQHLPVIKGSVLDFGCGCGVIGCWILSEKPDTKVDFVDVNWLATSATASSLKQNNLTPGQIYCANGISDINNKYKHIISNPPFHRGIDTNYDVTEQFIRNAYSKLVTGGDITIVANQFLKYEAIFKDCFGNCQEVTRAKGFKILTAKKLVNRR